jgi:hypothetical protein
MSFSVILEFIYLNFFVDVWPDINKYFEIGPVFGFLLFYILLIIQKNIKWQNKKKEGMTKKFKIHFSNTIQTTFLIFDLITCLGSGLLIYFFTLCMTIPFSGNNVF